MPYSEAEVHAAVAGLADGRRLAEAQRLVAAAAPQLQRVLAEALSQGGWFDTAHEQAVRQATDVEDPEERGRQVRTLLAEETRVAMLVGVAVGFELARELRLMTGREPGGPAAPG